MTEKKAFVGVCVVCAKNREIQHSLSLTRDKGKWIINPVCADCRQALLKDARSAGKFIPFFGIEASHKEAAKRNERTAFNRPFLEKFGRDLSSRPKPDDKARPTLKIVKKSIQKAR
jgi:hypothetical protein